MDVKQKEMKTILSKKSLIFTMFVIAFVMIIMSPCETNSYSRNSYSSPSYSSPSYSSSRACSVCKGKGTVALKKVKINLLTSKNSNNGI